MLSCIQLFLTPWAVACQSLLSMGFSKQEYWSKLPFPSPGDLPQPGIEPRPPALQADSLLSEPPGKPRSPKAAVADFHALLKARAVCVFPPVAPGLCSAYLD